MGTEAPTTFYIHEHLVCTASEFVNRAVGKNWSGSQTRSVRLVDHDPEIFHVYVHWLYRKSLPVRLDSPGEAGNEEYLQLAKSYVLGDMLVDADFKDAVLDAFIDKSRSKATDGCNWYPAGSPVRHIYDNTQDNSPARRLLVDMYTAYGHSGWLTRHASPEDLTSEFLLDLAVSLLDKRPRPGEVLEKDPCVYHEHGQGEAVCYRDRLA